MSYLTLRKSMAVAAVTELAEVAEATEILHFVQDDR
jgi:hypothetical protein